ncbi:diacylglycerol/lipid kinase family protein [Corynebacterium caspium]|uniref:diacylglycerol/lipid kinase family protein n=1 Tax=Corynebacterium caspium TaxID=234828 RepID=UPI00037E53D5|nr:Diacylglycerol kinase [Corynebacterium caspium DSM 44850]
MISNPQSTSSIAQDPALAARIIGSIRAVPGLRLHSVFTQYAGHAVDICRGLRRTDYDLVLVVGGDGTVNEVINGLLGSPTNPDLPAASELPRLAVIPTGSANVFSRALGFRLDPTLAAKQVAELLQKGTFRRIALGTWNQNWFAVNAGFGIDAAVIHRVERARSLGFKATPLRYMWISLEVWIRSQFEPPQMHVQARHLRVDGSSEVFFERFDLPLFFASNTNPWTYLGPLPVVTNPANSFDKGLGLFGLSNLHGILGALAMAHLVGVGHNKWLNRLTASRTLQFDDASSVTITCPQPESFQVDGEFKGKLRQVELASRADALEVIAPRHLNSRAVTDSRSVLMAIRDFLRVR